MPSRCSRGVTKSGRCKRKPGPKKSKSRRRRCSRGRTKSGRCKRKPGPKRSKSRRRKSKSRSRKSKSKKPRKMGRKLKANEFYCVNPACRKAIKVDDDDICVKKYPSGRVMLKASGHSHKLFKFIKDSKYAAAAKKYGRC